MTVAARGSHRGLMGLATELLRGWRPLLAVPAAAAAVAAAVTSLRPAGYEAAVVFTAEETQAAVPEALRTVIAGMSLGTADPGWQRTYYFEALLSSRDVLRQAVLTEYTDPGPPRVRGTFARHLGLASPASPASVNQAIAVLGSSIRTEVNPHASLIRVWVTARSPALSEALARRLLALVEERDGARLLAQGEARRVFLQARLRESAASLQAAEAVLSDYVGGNRFGRETAPFLLDEYSLENEVSMRREVHDAVSQAHEQAVLDAQSTPAPITIVAAPEGSARPRSRHVGLQAVLAALLGLIVTMVFLGTRQRGHS